MNKVVYIVENMDIYWEMLLTSLYSCIKNTNLRPTVIICGDSNSQSNVIKLIRSKGIEIRYMHSDMWRNLSSKYPMPLIRDALKDSAIPWASKFITESIYLKLDMLKSFNEEAYLLLVDIDTIFTENFYAGDRISDHKPKILAANNLSCVDPIDGSPEKYTNINAGFVLFNVARVASDLEQMAEEFDRQYAYCMKCLDSGNMKGYYPSNLLEEWMLATLYKGQWEILPPEYNWRPNWGYSDRAKLIHYQGYKPTDLNNPKRIKAIEEDDRLNIHSYMKYLDIYTFYKEKAFDWFRV
jgi:hypothetical protein